jgi:hypothetical protein
VEKVSCDKNLPSTVLSMPADYTGATPGECGRAPAAGGYRTTVGGQHGTKQETFNVELENFAETQRTAQG